LKAPTKIVGKLAVKDEPKAEAKTDAKKVEKKNIDPKKVQTGNHKGNSTQDS